MIMHKGSGWLFYSWGRAVCVCDKAAGCCRRDVEPRVHFGLDLSMSYVIIHSILVFSCVRSMCTYAFHYFPHNEYQA